MIESKHSTDFVTPGRVCHHTMLFECCNVSNVLCEKSAVVPGGATLHVGGRPVQVNFLYSGGGYGSKEELSKLCVCV